jgi:hypothetical protein
VAKNEERLWLHTTLDRQLSMIQRNRRTDFDYLFPELAYEGDIQKEYSD